MTLREKTYDLHEEIINTLIEKVGDNNTRAWYI